MCVCSCVRVCVLACVLFHVRALSPSSGVFRSHGVRRECVNMNIGVRKYAFNSLVQRFVLPQHYQPPPGTGKGNLVT